MDWIGLGRGLQCLGHATARAVQGTGGRQSGTTVYQSVVAVMGVSARVLRGIVACRFGTRDYRNRRLSVGSDHLAPDPSQRPTRDSGFRHFARSLAPRSLWPQIEICSAQAELSRSAAGSNGYGLRTWDAGVGPIALAIPLRGGTSWYDVAAASSVHPAGQPQSQPAGDDAG